MTDPESPETTEFNPEYGQAIFHADRIRELLDMLIEYWRQSDEVYAEYYVDAYQSMRRNLFGEVKPESTDDD